MSIGSNLANGWGNFPNVITGGATDIPDWDPANLDAGTNAIIAQQAAEGGLTQQQIAQQQLQGTSPTMAAATGGQVAQQQATLGGDSSDNAAVSAALNDRANRLYSAQYNQLQNAAIAGAPARQAQLMTAAAGGLQDQQNVNDQLNRQQIAVTLQKQSLRNQIIGSILSGAGAAVGSYEGAKKGKVQPADPTADNQYSGDPGDPTFMGPQQENAINQNTMGNAYTGPDYGTMGPQYGQDGNGYMGEVSPGAGQGYNGTQPMGGYGLGITSNGVG